ncbi:NAD(P)/FAD-dependent oxidoreductase [Dokdonia sp.]|uniref:flavin monoamine oxidase family protein n=1 Tax=Dokdonia sp. TaxID=2024995 RepID=UPI003266753D
MKKNVLIIGAGLTGLLLAYKLKQQGIPVIILEARDRIGGRIHTYLSNQETPIEMGATWLGLQHKALVQLLKELHIPIYPQYMDGKAWYEPTSLSPAYEVALPPNESPSYRIQGGSISLIKKLAEPFTSEELQLNTVVTKIEAQETQFKVTTQNNVFTASKVVTTLPPNLLVNTIQFEPKLPENLSAISKKTHTWMGESIKFGISYNRAFWKDQDWSGTLFSNVGPITEMYDHSNSEQNKFALKGFLDSSLSSQTKEARKIAVFEQLKRSFGEEALSYLSYEETIWKDQKYTSTPYENYVLPHQNNGQAIYKNTYYNDRYYIAGSETAQIYGGYMEGAVQSAQTCFEHILQR